MVTQKKLIALTPPNKNAKSAKIECKTGMLFTKKVFSGKIPTPNEPVPAKATKIAIMRFLKCLLMKYELAMTVKPKITMDELKKNAEVLPQTPSH